MKQRMIAGLALAAVLVWAAAEKKTETPEALLGAAIHQQEAEGNLEAAIDGYKKFLAQYGSHRPLAAKAQFRLGVCYEKLGKPEAREAYERVLREYADQREIAAEAHTRLAALGNSKPAYGRAAGEKAGVIIRELRLESSQEKHALSPDGNKIVYTKRGGNLFVRDLVSGAEKQVTKVESGYAF